MTTKKLLTLILCLLSIGLFAQTYPFNGISVNMGNLSKLSKAKSRSISPENFSGEKGKGGMSFYLNNRWKASSTLLTC